MINEFHIDHVYVFLSGVTEMKQLVINQNEKVCFYQYNHDKNSIFQVSKPKSSMVCCLLSINIDEMNDKYFEEYKIFYKDVFYWQYCEYH
jgi:hypothetical protein